MYRTNTPILAERAVHSAFSTWYAAVATGERIKWAREQAGISRRHLAEYACMSDTTLARIENGERTLTGRELAAIARGIGVSLGFLTVGAHDGHGRRAA